MTISAYSIYDTATGEVLQTGQAQDDVLSLLPQAGEAVLNQAIDPDLYYVVAGVAQLRPVLPAVTISNDVFELVGGLPAGVDVSLTAVGSYYSGAVDLLADSAVLEVTDTSWVTVTLDAGWPYLPVEFQLDGSGGGVPAGAQTISVNLVLFRGAKIAEVDLVVDSLHGDLLGGPSALQLREMQTQTVLFLQDGGGAISVAGRDALDAGESYLGRTAEVRLSEIGQKVEYWNWLSERVSGLRAEYLYRLGSAATVSDVLAAEAWFKSQSTSIVGEASARVPA